MTDAVSRRGLVAGLPLAFGFVALGGCVTPPEPAPPPEAPPPPVIVVTSLAAYATVVAASPGHRELVLQTAGGGMLNLTAGPEMRNFGQYGTGARVILEYGANGVPRLARPSRALERAAASAGRIRATVQGVEPGGRHMTLRDTQGAEQEVTIEDGPMMAFAARLRAGDEVSVTVQQR